MFNPHAYQNSITAGAAFMELIQHPKDAGEIRPDEEIQPVYMPLKESHLSGSVTGPVARLQLRHTFGCADEVDAPVLEAVYRFPLPGDAAVTGVRVTFGETVIRAELADRLEAERDYDDARATGRQAILLSRESPDVFSLHVSGIEPGQDVQIETSFVQSLQAERRGFSLRVPLTPAPRYTSPGGTGGRHEHGQPLSPAHDPGHRFSLDLTVFGAATVRSSTHCLQLDELNGASRMALADGVVIPDRDLVIELTPPEESERPSLQVFRHQDDHEYLLALVQPPAGIVSTQIRGREVVLLVDRSGSMSGPKQQAADWAVRRFLSGLKPDDSFSLGLFHTETRWFSRVSVPATAENVSAARAFLNAYDDTGGTQLETALEEAIVCGRAAGDLARHIVIITDAQVSNARANLALARAEAERPNRRRISLLCIDAAPNAYLVHELASIGGGHASFLTSDPDEGDIATALDDLMDLWEQPAAPELSLIVNRPDVWVMGRTVSDVETVEGDAGRIDLGDLPAGRPLWVVARATKVDEPLSVMLIGRDGEVIAATSDSIRSDAALKALFGVRRLNALEYQLEPSGFNWRPRHRSVPPNENLRKQLVAESLDYGLVCAETSFVAIREEGGKLVQRGAIVPNALPHGWASGAVLYSMASPDQGAMESLVQYEADPASSDHMAPAPTGEYEVRNISSQAGRRFSPRRQESRISRGGRLTLFEGVPDVSRDETALFDQERFGRSGRLTELRVDVDNDVGSFDCVLELYTGVYDRPRASVRLRDVLNQRGVRPLNISVSRRDRVRLVLRDATPGAPVPSMRIELVWE